MAAGPSALLTSPPGRLLDRLCQPLNAWRSRTPYLGRKPDFIRAIVVKLWFVNAGRVRVLVDDLTRPGEDPRWEMVDRAAGTITIPTSKNSHGRVLALSGELADLMKRREATRLVETPDRGIRVAEHVFHRRGHPLGDFKRVWATARIKADLAHTVKDASGKVITKKDGTPRYVFEKTIHDFRRTAPRNLARAGVRRDVAKAITGHKTDVMFSRYNITDEADLRDGMEKVSVYVASLPNQADAK